MNKKILQLLIGITLLLNACSNGKIEKIPLEIPLELQGDTQAAALISEMTDAANDCRVATMKIAAVAVKNKNDSPGLMQKLKMGKNAIRFAKAQSKMSACLSQAQDMGVSLSEGQHSQLMACIKMLEKRSVEIDDPQAALGMTPEEFERFKKEGITLSNASNEEAPYKEADSLDKYRGETSGFMDENSNSGEVIEMPRFMHILFPLLVIGLFVFFGIRRIKKFFNKTKEIGYTISSTKSKMKEVHDMMEQEGDKDSPEYQNAKKALDFMDKLTNKNN